MSAELVAAVRALLAELEEARAHGECGECPPTVETEQRLRAALEALEQKPAGELWYVGENRPDGRGEWIEVDPT